MSIQDYVWLNVPIFRSCARHGIEPGLIACTTSHLPTAPPRCQTCDTMCLFRSSVLDVNIETPGPGVTQQPGNRTIDGVRQKAIVGRCAALDFLSHEIGSIV